MKDFTKPKRESIMFKIDEDTFSAVAAIGAEVLRPVIMGGISDIEPGLLARIVDGKVEDASREELVAMIDMAKKQTGRTMEFLDLVLEPESALRFAERMRSTVDPITMEQATEVFQWLLGEYGNRPTKPSNSSAASPEGNGTSSTVGAQLETSIPSS